MPKPILNKASTVWNGNLVRGSGTTTLETSGLGSFSVNWKARAEESGRGTTTPEELIAAAHASCFSMALSHELTGNKTPPVQINTTAEVTFLAGSGITGIHLTVLAEVPEISATDFARIAEAAKVGCPVSQALAAVPITLSATLA